MPEKYIPANIASYLNKRAVSKPWQLNALPARTFSGAVVIPALAEAANLPQTLESLSRNPSDLLDNFLILVVVNQRVDASTQETADNLATLTALPHWRQQFHLQNLYWIDAASSGMELPTRQGVGLARKIGLDAALNLLDYTGSDPLLVCLDADTLVQPDYLAALTHHFTTATEGGASIPYCHRQAMSQAAQTAIDRYELFLRAYVLGLKLAGSPYAFHTVGSAMACRTSAYVAAGGMNKRLAGEDFYFLQQLHKTSGVAQLTGTVVHPSPRSSHRVPFGTGRSVGDMLCDGEQRLLFYHPAVFSILSAWLNCVRENCEAETWVLLKEAETISPFLLEFIQQSGFEISWNNLKLHNNTKDRLLNAFHSWFDAFRCMRLIHHLSDRGYPRVAPELAVAPLFTTAGFTVANTVTAQLAQLRKLQNAA